MAQSANGSSRKPTVSLFIQNTYNIVEHSNKAIVDWSADGMSFIIKDESRFSAELPKHFRHGKFRSFVRQLNAYGFRKLNKDEVPPKTPHDHKYYHHSSFQRGKPQLLKDICQKRKESELETVQELYQEIDTLKDQVKKLQKQQDVVMNWIVQVSCSAQGTSAEPGAAPAAETSLPLTVPGVSAPFAARAPPKRTSALLRRNSSVSSSVAGHKRRRNSNDEAVAEGEDFIGLNEGVASLSRERSITRSMSRQRSGLSQHDAAEASAWPLRFQSVDINDPNVLRNSSVSEWKDYEWMCRADSLEKEDVLHPDYALGTSGEKRMIRSLKSVASMPRSDTIPYEC